MHTYISGAACSLSFQYIMVVIVLRMDAAPSWLGIGVLLARSFLRYI